MNLFVNEIGSEGRPVVLLHGWGLHGDLLLDVAQGLAGQGFRVFVVDLPGHGRSVQVPNPYTLDNLVATLAPVMPENAAWLGWSLGGMVALQFAYRYPHRVSRLGMIASSPCFVQKPQWPYAVASSVLQQFAHDLTNDYRTTLLRFLALQAKGSENARDAVRLLRERAFAYGEPQVAVLSGGLDILLSSDLRIALRDLSCPVKFFVGQHDLLMPPQAAFVLAEQQSNIAVQQFNGAAHAPFISHPQLFLVSVKAFLDG